MTAVARVSVEPVARLEVWAGSIPVTVGWELRASCGCYALEGMRMDRPGPRDLAGEPVIGFYSCTPGHAPALAELRRSMGEDFDEVERSLHDVLVERFARALE